LPLQAIVRDDDSLSMAGGSAGFAASLAFGAGVERSVQRRVSPIGCIVAVLVFVVMTLVTLVSVFFSHR
jgi:hypothetical protein